MLIIDIKLTGEMASGKTRATKAIEEGIEGILAAAISDKPYLVRWNHAFPNGKQTESGSFEGGK